MKDDKDKQVTTNDIMEFLQTHMVMRSDFNKFRTKVDNLNVKFYDTGIIMKNIEQRLAHMEKNILTKEYLDLKIKEFLANLDQLIVVDNP